MDSGRFSGVGIVVGMFEDIVGMIFRFRRLDEVVVFYLVCLPIPKISERIEKGEIASGLWLGVSSLAGGILNAASMTN